MLDTHLLDLGEASVSVVQILCVYKVKQKNNFRK